MLDIRTESQEPIKSIRFGDTPSDDTLVATILRMIENDEGEAVVEVTDDEGDNVLQIFDKETAEYLCKAIKYAIDQQWWDYGSDVYVDDEEGKV
jgi:hypothetical protein